MLVMNVSFLVQLACGPNIASARLGIKPAPLAYDPDPSFVCGRRPLLSIFWCKADVPVRPIRHCENTPVESTLSDHYLADMYPDDPIDYPIDGTLDLHQFQPKEVAAVVEAYIRECIERGVFAIRIVHGKGIGVQREIVRSLLEKHPNVISFRHEESSGGGWGATVVDLKP